MRYCSELISKMNQMCIIQFYATLPNILTHCSSISVLLCFCSYSYVFCSMFSWQFINWCVLCLNIECYGGPVRLLYVSLCVLTPLFAPSPLEWSAITCLWNKMRFILPQHIFLCPYKVNPTSQYSLPQCNCMSVFIHALYSLFSHSHIYIYKCICIKKCRNLL